jgi:hypothetical protein
MKQKKYIPAVTLIGFGIYFYLMKSTIIPFDGFYTWPTLLAIVGIAFSVQFYVGNDPESILPGILLFGLGVHFHLRHFIHFWPDDTSILFLLLAIGFLLRAQKTKQGNLPGLVFLMIAIIQMFYSKMKPLPYNLENGLFGITAFWPILIIIVGVYFLLNKKK